MSVAVTALRHSRAAVLVTAALVVAGALAAVSLPSSIYPPLQFPPGNLFLRRLVTLALAQVERCSPHEIAARMWPSDLELRATTAPAMTTVTR